MEAVDVFAGVATGDAILDQDEARRALAVLADPDGHVQLESVPSGQQAVLPGSDIDGLLAAAQLLCGGQHLYFGLNPVRADLMKCARLADVTRRYWIPVDVDAKRPDTSVPATEAEHDAAREMSLRVMDDLRHQGWPAPVIVDTGNGFQNLYRCDLPNDQPTRDLIKATLATLARAYDDAGAAVDRATHKANQHVKLPGSMARKGIHTDERPHRRVRLVSVPERLELVTKELLAEVAQIDGGSVDDSSAPRPTLVIFDGVAQSGSNGNTNGYAYARRALDYELSRVYMARPGSDGGRNNALNTAAFCVFQLVAGEEIGREEVETALYNAGRTVGLSDGEIRSTMRSAWEAASRQPRKAPESGGHPEPVTATAEEMARPRKPIAQAAGRNGHTGESSQQPASRPTIYTLPELLGMDLPPPSWAVPGLMSEGLTILAGKPKLGKSWIALNLALTLAAGGMALGSTQVVPGDVLYLSLEDRLRRVKDRAAKVLAGLNLQASKRLHIAVEWPRINSGGLDEIGCWVDTVERPALIIIDVWSKFRDVYKQGNQYDQDYQAAGALKMVADAHHTSVLVVHHCKKGKAEDAVEEISGTLGLSGAADGVMVLTRARSENEATLFLTGRDIEEQELALEFLPANCVWKCNGTAAEQTDSKLKAGVIETFKSNPGVSFTVKMMADHIGVQEQKLPSLRVLMYRMAKDNLICLAGAGKFKWPVDQPVGTF